jgi:hypothetical protein
MFVEIALMQKFVLFLGHPTYALSVILFSLLVSSGLGSLFSVRMLPERALVIALPLLPGLIVVLLSLFDPIMSVALGASLVQRIGVAILMIVPVGFFMGMPFPAALRIVSRRSADFIPWAFGVNGCASVVASILAIALAMESSFSVVLGTGAAFYGLLLFVRPRGEPEGR